VAPPGARQIHVHAPKDSDSILRVPGRNAAATRPGIRPGLSGRV
jgi:hypothetical protein